MADKRQWRTILVSIRGVGGDVHTLPMVAIYQAWEQSDPHKARALQFSILPLIRAMFAPPFLLGFKIALETRGFQMGPGKHALSSADESKCEKVKSRVMELMTRLLGDRLVAGQEAA